MTLGKVGEAIVTVEGVVLKLLKLHSEVEDVLSAFSYVVRL